MSSDNILTIVMKVKCAVCDSKLQASTQGSTIFVEPCENCINAIRGAA